MSIWTKAALALLSAGALTAQAATPYTEATVTRVQNKVSYKGGQSDPRPAAAQDVVRAMDYLLSENDSRAELKYADGTIVRIGQNTVFSFEADSRTLNLKKGTFVFHVPKGQGGAIIKTPSLTAAITGTMGKVSDDTIAIIEGSIRLIPSGEIVSAGQFVRRNPDGSLTIDFYKKGTEFDGVLMTFNGDLAPFRESSLTPKLDMSAINTQETLDRTTNQPGAFTQFFPITPNEVKKDDNNNQKPIVVVTTPTPPPPKERIPGHSDSGSGDGEGGGFLSEARR